ncbi:MAG: cytochrome c family protein [Planctomycetota bacterium]
MIAKKNLLLLKVLAGGFLSAALGSVTQSEVRGQGVQCDPTKVLTAESCATCHANEVAVWKKTPHFRTYEELSRRPRAKEICKNMGLRSVKRSDVCIQCHFTRKEINGKIKPVSGISCESCHGASKDWITIHNDYGGPTATKASESEAHKSQRLLKCESLGMRNTRDFYSIASSCFSCHTVPNEKLVNVGGHKAGTEDFELVRFSQGMIRHNFLRGENKTNVKSTPEKLRLMFLVGLIADLEYSTRATGMATSKSKFGLTLANRAADKAVKLYDIQKTLKHPDIEQVLQVFAPAELRINNTQQLNSIANQIQSIGRKFAKENDGSQLAAVDPFLPDPSDYKWKASR